jgi:nucleoside-diphosphate-sugar epimerase
VNGKDIVIVTGSSGLIGSALIRRIASRYSVVGLDREEPTEPPPQSEWFSVDLTKDESVRDVLARVQKGYGPRLAAVIHLAAYYDFSGAPSPKYDEITVRGTERLLRALRAFEVERFVSSSTMLVHAPSRPGQRINEDWPLDPRWEYPQSKVRAEEVIRNERGAILTSILRIAGVYDDRCHSPPLAHQIKRVYEGRLTGHVYPGNIRSGQSFVHLDDVVDAVDRVIERRNSLPAETTILLGEPETVSYGELQRELGHLIRGEDWRTRRVPKLIARAGAWLRDKMPWGEDPFIKPWMIDRADDHYELDISRARDLLGWEPARFLRETLPLMVQALRADSDRFYRENKLGAPPRRKSVG